MKQVTQPAMQTSEQWHQTTFPVAGVVILALACQPGTGGQFSTNYYKQRGSMGYSHFSQGPSLDVGELARSTSDAVSHIRQVMNLTVTELANQFDVSRQTIYDWQAGKSTSFENASRIENLAKAADVLVDAGIPLSAQTLRRKIKGGKTLCESIYDGAPAQAAALSLVHLLNNEAAQRQALNRRLADRKLRNIAASEFGTPALDEQG